MYTYQYEGGIDMNWHVSVTSGRHPTLKLRFSCERRKKYWSTSKLDKHESNACINLHIKLRPHLQSY
jgi:hypothetical protein